jgi:hypothetical protein
MDDRKVGLSRFKSHNKKEGLKILNAHIVYVIVVALFLVLAALASWRHWGPNRFPIIVYVIGIAVVWAVILGVMWFLGDIARFQTFALVGLGFALGMLAMYIAVHVYKS